MTGGVREAHLTVKNTGGTACAVAGRPWLRIPRLPHPITVTDIVDGPFAGACPARKAQSVQARAGVPARPRPRVGIRLWERLCGRDGVHAVGLLELAQRARRSLRGLEGRPSQAGESSARKALG
jgi:hypothetical protein